MDCCNWILGNLLVITMIDYHRLFSSLIMNDGDCGNNDKNHDYDYDDAGSGWLVVMLSC